MRAVLIPIQGPLTVVNVTDWREMAAAIGADAVERVTIGPNSALLVDESGLLLRKPINHRASFLYGKQYHGRSLVGPALYMHEDVNDEGERDFVDFDAEEFMPILEMTVAG